VKPAPRSIARAGALAAPLVIASERLEVVSVITSIDPLTDPIKNPAFLSGERGFERSVWLSLADGHSPPLNKKYKENNEEQRETLRKVHSLVGSTDGGHGLHSSFLACAARLLRWRAVYNIKA
jgi:hypothetical protein